MSLSPEGAASYVYLVEKAIELGRWIGPAILRTGRWALGWALAVRTVSRMRKLSLEPWTPAPGPSGLDVALARGATTEPSETQSPWSKLAGTARHCDFRTYAEFEAWRADLRQIRAACSWKRHNWSR